MKQPASVCLFLINREKVAQQRAGRGRCQVCEEAKGGRGESESAIELEEGGKEGTAAEPSMCEK